MLAALFIGFFSSIHCLGMCGGIVGTMTMSLPIDIRQSTRQLFGYSIAYNIGRLSSYTLAGLIVGYLGQSLSAFVPVLAGDSLRIIFSLLLILLGFYMSGWFPKLANIEKLGQGFWLALQPLLKKVYPVKNHFQALFAGMLWGWLPCGLVYYTLGIAATKATPLDSALFMLAFGCGTLLAMLSASLLFGKLGNLRQSGKLRGFAAITLILWGLFSLISIFNASGHHHLHGAV